MPRVSVWITQPQLDWAKRRFGADSNLSGVVQAGMAMLEGATDPGTRLGDGAERLVEIVSAIEDAQIRAGAVARARRQGGGEQ